MSRQQVDLLFFGLLVLPMLLYQAWLVWKWRCREQARKRELERELRRDMEEILQQTSHEKIPRWFHDEMMKQIPIEHGGSFKEEIVDDTSQAKAAERPATVARRRRG